MSEKNLFIPLKTEHYEAFDCGDKKAEYRLYGPRWNERTCRVGRKVTLSKGYGKWSRREGVVSSFRKVEMWGVNEKTRKALKALYPGVQRRTQIAIIGIDLEATHE